MKTFFNIALIISSIATVVLVVLQNRGVGMGSIAGGSDPSTIFTQRRGVEKVIFNLTMSLILIYNDCSGTIERREMGGAE